MKNTTKYRLLLFSFVGVTIFAFFHYAYPYHLLHKEQLLLFTYSAEQLSGYLSRPAFLSCLCGDFLTQFLHFNGLGAVVVTLLLIALGELSYTVARKWCNPGIAMIAATVIPIGDAFRLCDIIYPLSGTISLLGGLSLFFFTSLLKGKWSFVIASACGILASYWLFGYGMLVFALLSLLTAITRNRSYTAASLILAEAVATPCVLSGHYLLTSSQAYTYPVTAGWSFPDFENERMLGMNTEDYLANWDKVLELSHPDLHTGMFSVSHNLANAMQGKLADRLMNYYQPAGLGLFMPINEESNYLSTQLAGEVWFQLGDMTMAEHATLLSMIFSPQHKGARAVQRLAEINLINGDAAAAMKYLRLLSQTLAYKRWAEERMPGKESESVKKWLQEKQGLLPLQDTIRTSTTDIAKSLHLLLDANPNNRMARDYLLCFHLLMKDLPSFMKDYKQYHREKPGRLYAEALLIQLYKEQATGKEIQDTGMSPDVVQSFNEYNYTHTQSKGSPDALASTFGKSYWFYYQFVQFQ